MWAENALFVIGKGVTNRKNDNELDEALLGADALVVIIKELQKRQLNDF